MTISETFNADYIDDQYRQWKENPKSVSSDWHYFFKGFELARPERIETEGICSENQVLLQARVESLIYRYRDIGHLLSCLDPLLACPVDHPLLNLSAFNLSDAELDTSFHCSALFYDQKAQLKDIIEALKETYCRSIGVEFMHIQDPEERNWLLERMEPSRNKPGLKKDSQQRILRKLYEASLFEQFLNKKYPGQTRFSAEGAEAIIAMLDALVLYMAGQGCREIILGMAHRGRLNVQVNVLNKTYEDIFQEFEQCYDPDSLTGTGDVKYHNGYMADIDINRNRLRVLLVNNPSHLESVNPVVEGIARARQVFHKDDNKKRVIPLLLHGDSAFAGQGVVAETLNMSQLSGYSTGGTIHLVINNQIGYTTLPENARSTRYPTDIAKMLMSPIFHVHGENPEAAVHVVKLACEYRQKFGKDVVIDLVCYRRYGHNEGDEPYFTQPQMYDRIKERPPLHQIYAEKLKNEKIMTDDRLSDMEKEITESLETSFDNARDQCRGFPVPKFFESWDTFHGNYSHDSLETGVSAEKLKSLARKLNSVPENFSVFKKLKTLLDKRLEAVESEKTIDWGNAEALSFASLLDENIPIRLSGQDSGRGTFSQRHSVLTDIKTSEQYTPLNNIGTNQASYRVYDSMLSETGILGFEYGYSLSQPEGLIIWEAQFGDFVNNAQSIIDLYITSGEAKWQRLSGLVMLLPHGLEGLGPEHSSARPERFLQLCAHDNIQVCIPTLPSQYFHLLRRQVKVGYRKPLVILSPKSLLRHPLAVSSLKDLENGSFQQVIDDPNPPSKAERVILCSGKIFYELFSRRQKRGDDDIAIVRLEQYYPFPEHSLKNTLSKYSKAKHWYWVQEEPSNMGAWNFLRFRLAELMKKSFEYIGREASASPATGFPRLYRKQQENILSSAVGSSEDSDATSLNY
ncbi:MAG: 2-oxoglutarate dehydrogenase E1 component [Desulfobacterales bacterium]